MLSEKLGVHAILGLREEAESVARQVMVREQPTALPASWWIENPCGGAMPLLRRVSSEPGPVGALPSGTGAP